VHRELPIVRRTAAQASGSDEGDVSATAGVVTTRT
jgi:hypothetical protein